MRRCFIILIAVFFCTIALRCALPPNNAPEAVHGILDLSSRDFVNSSPVSLKGEWEFYWGKLLTPSNFIGNYSTDENSFIRVPGIWNGKIVNGQPLGGEGCATYRLHIRVPAERRVYGFKILDQASSYTVWINGTTVASNGTVAATKELSRPEARSVIVYYEYKGRQGPADGLDVVIQVANFHQHQGGLWQEITISSYDNAIISYYTGLLILTFIAGSIVIMSLYHFGLAFFGRSDRASLYFGIFSVMVLIRDLLVGERLVTYVIPSFNWAALMKIEYITGYESIVFLFLFIYSLYLNGAHRKKVYILTGIGALLALLTAATPVSFFSGFKIIFNAYLVLSGGFLIGILALLSWRRVEGAFITLVSFLFLFALAINDMLYHSYIIHTSDLTPIGLFFFILAESFILSRRFSCAFQTVGKLSEELARTNAELVSVDRMKDEFLANTTHELSTPLNGIVGIVESLVDGAAGPVTPAQKYNLSMVQYSATRLANLVNDILDFARIKNSDIALVKRSIDIHPLVDMILMISKPLAGNRGIRMANRVPRDLVRTFGDENRIQQILQNLVGNAIKFTENGSVEVEACVAGNFIEICVVDTGIGIPDDKLEAVFDSFVQADGSISRIYGGTGLGLAITKKLVELHGGTIRAESRINEGSRFIFTLPVFNPATMEDDPAVGESSLISSALIHDIAPQNPDAMELMNPGKGSHLLIVDDDPVNLQVMTNHLSAFGYRITAAACGEDAFMSVERDRPDLMLLDVMMPRISGYDVCRKLREQFNHGELPIIMVTAKRLVSDLVAGFDAGANDYLVKPFGKRELLARVNTMLRLREATRDRENLLVMEQELDIAQLVQKNVLGDPATFASMEQCEIDVVYIPQNNKVGGDYYNVSQITPDCVSVVIADATGHGIQAALSTMQIDILNKQTTALIEPETRMTGINNFYINELRSRNFFTAFILNILPGRIAFASAGHLPQLLVKNSTGKIINMKTRGKMIGIQTNVSYDRGEMPVESGDIILLFTDGIYEEFNGKEEYGEEKFEKLIREGFARGAHRGPIRDFMRPLIESVRQFMVQSRYCDDITLIGIKVR
jgi:two-component system sensor histidine kinase ChiS